MNEYLKTELECCKIQNNKLKKQWKNQSFKDRNKTIQTGILASVGSVLTPGIHKIAMDIGVKRTHVGKYKVHGRTYRNKKLAEIAWRKDCSLFHGLGLDRGGKRDFAESIIASIGNFAPIMLPLLMKDKI